MRELIDCHVHTERSGHGSGTVAQMVSAAVFKGLTGLVVTEHLPLPDDLDPQRHLSMCPEELEAYAEEVELMAGRVRGLDVVLGAEADWLPGREEEAALSRGRALDAGVRVFLGSVHFLGDWAFDDPHNLEAWDDRDVDEVWTDYFTHWCNAARSGLFDVMAHPDLPKKFGHLPTRNTADLFAEAAAAARDGGVLVEVSTAGLRKPVGELYPGPSLLAAFQASGVDVTVGSDAHATDELGYRIGDAYDAAYSAGFRRVALPLGGGEVRWVKL